MVDLQSRRHEDQFNQMRKKNKRVRCKNRMQIGPMDMRQKSITQIVS